MKHEPPHCLISQYQRQVPTDPYGLLSDVGHTDRSPVRIKNQVGKVTTTHPTYIARVQHSRSPLYRGDEIAD